MNHRKALKKLMRKMGVACEQHEPLPDGRIPVEVSGATFFFDKDGQCVTATTTATARRWVTKRDSRNGVEHG